MNEVDYKRILERLTNELDFLISQQADPFYLAHILQNYGKEHYTDEDLVEMRGYYEGLKVAREALKKAVAFEEAESWSNWQ